MTARDTHLALDAARRDEGPRDVECARCGQATMPDDVREGLCEDCRDALARDWGNSRASIQHELERAVLTLTLGWLDGVIRPEAVLARATLLRNHLNAMKETGS